MARVTLLPSYGYADAEATRSGNTEYAVIATTTAPQAAPTPVMPYRGAAESNILTLALWDGGPGDRAALGAPIFQIEEEFTSPVVGS